MKKLEKRIEQMLVDKVKARGGRAYKFTSPGMEGVPDRIIVLPEETFDPHIIMVETKAPGEKLRPRQEQEIQTLRSLGVTVFVIDQQEQVEELLEWLSNTSRESTNS